MEKKKIFILILLGFIIFFMLYAVFQIRWANLFSPGELSIAHAEFDQSGDCGACHTKWMKLDNSKCLECHKEIKSEIKKDFGLHGRASKGEECSRCHSEHHGREYDLSYLDVDTFDHTTTGWSLEGVHSLLKCEACHSRDSYLLGMNECVLCHKDVHLGQLGVECHKCHNPKSFEIIDYQHQITEKSPKGKHLQLECDECHTEEHDIYPSAEGSVIKYVGIDFTCSKCHEDVHDGEYGANCSECHNQNNFEVE